jgi:hypothetical protein
MSVSDTYLASQGGHTGDVRVLRNGEKPGPDYGPELNLTLTVQLAVGSPLCGVLKAIQREVAAIPGIHPRVRIRSGAEPSEDCL